jgi:hypothetical protein
MITLTVNRQYLRQNQNGPAIKLMVATIVAIHAIQVKTYNSDLMDGIFIIKLITVYLMYTNFPQIIVKCNYLWARKCLAN